MTHIFENETGCVIGSRKEDEKVFPWDCQLLYSHRQDMIQTSAVCSNLVAESVSVFRIEFQEKRKVRANYLSSIGGVKSVQKVTEEENMAGHGW